MSDWNMHPQQQQHARQHQQQYQQQRSQSMSVPASQFSTQPLQYPSGDYGQHNYDRRQPTAYPPPIQPLQVNPSSFSQPDAPHNLPSSSLPAGPPMARGDRHRAQSVALTAIGQREPHGYASSSGYPRMAHRSGTTGPNYPGSEATVPISRHHSGSRTWSQYPSNDPLPPPTEPQVPYISSVMSPHQQQMGVPSRMMPPLHELDRRMPAIDEAQPRPKPHVCEQCGAAFSRAHDLKRHVETHKGDRPHKCPTCTKAFSRKDALQRHQSMAQCGVDSPEMYQ